jgi:hypothetical protein
MAGVEANALVSASTGEFEEHGAVWESNSVEQSDSFSGLTWPLHAGGPSISLTLSSFKQHGAT